MMAMEQAHKEQLPHILLQFLRLLHVLLLLRRARKKRNEAS
jgi:hypothetical protein